ncbi:MAG: hypothetical protein HYU36_21120 [Planctomycetes bacterium]|nr:hypothetical protein [Planctomycetota bacterium]
MTLTLTAPSTYASTGVSGAIEWFLLMTLWVLAITGLIANGLTIAALITKGSKRRRLFLFLKIYLVSTLLWMTFWWQSPMGIVHTFVPIRWFSINRELFYFHCFVSFLLFVVLAAWIWMYFKGKNRDFARNRTCA